MAIPNDPETQLLRKATAEALTEAGFPTSEATLATKASRGGGPKYRKWGARPLYVWRDALEWAQSKLSPPVHSTSELEAVRQRNCVPVGYAVSNENASSVRVGATQKATGKSFIGHPARDKQAPADAGPK